MSSSSSLKDNSLISNERDSFTNERESLKKIKLAFERENTCYYCNYANDFCIDFVKQNNYLFEYYLNNWSVDVFLQLACNPEEFLLNNGNNGKNFHTALIMHIILHLM